jgi:riboflavin synthase
MELKVIKRNNLGTERQIPHILTCLCKLKAYFMEEWCRIVATTNWEGARGKDKQGAIKHIDEELVLVPLSTAR